MLPRSKAPLLLLTVAGVVATVALVLPPIPQPLFYHNFADHRPWLGIPNFGDVASNLPFAIIGFWGLLVLFVSPTATFIDSRERWPYALMFAGLILTAIGSGYYHLAPGNARLVWDRIPINITIMALLTAVIAERISIVASLQGHGDLRFYAAVQVYAILVLLLALLFPPRYTRGADFAVVVGFYVLAKLLEESDRPIFAFGHIVSGHTLKHLAAAAAGFWILRMLKKRKAVEQIQGTAR